MAEFVQDAAAALLLPPAAAAPVGLALLLELSLAHPASPALAASTAIAAMAATLICLIRRSSPSPSPQRSRELLSRTTGRAPRHLLPPSSVSPLDLPARLPAPHAPLQGLWHPGYVLT